MSKTLVIVESPAKARTINRYLGADYEVLSSAGHIRDLPTKRKKTSKPGARLSPAAKFVENVGVDPENGWKAHYEILPGKEKVVRDLRQAAKKASAIYLATDRDREGEAIAWHLREAIGGDASRYRRVVFSEITRRAIEEAFTGPGELDMDRVNAQQARRFLDRLVGFMLSPLLWVKVARGLSAGRVQSVAVRMIADREREIRAFVPEEYWELFGFFRHQKLGPAEDPLKFQIVRHKGKKFRPENEKEAKAAEAELAKAGYQVTDRTDKPTIVKPGPPFITSTLQQLASSRLGFNVRRTMTLAQRLYEAGHITYMRTDSVNLSPEAVKSARELIAQKYGKKYLPPKPNLYASGQRAQEAHEAIRPSDCELSAQQLKGMEKDAQRLYDLIWRRFLACQMLPARYTSTSITAQAGDYELRARGRVLLFDGFTKLQPAPRKRDEDMQLPDLRPGDNLDLVRLEPKQHFTKPPARYSEASLVGELEKRSIGRPSTYASIISTIQERGYVSLVKGRFHAEKIGDVVTSRLMECFTNLMDYGFTAHMEELLDAVATGERDWRALLDEYYQDLATLLEKAKQPEGGMRAHLFVPAEIACPDCGRPMLIRLASSGIFLGCSGYAKGKSAAASETCAKTINLASQEEVADIDSNEEDESRVLRAMRRCPKCASVMAPYRIDDSRMLHICGNFPECSGQELEHGEFPLPQSNQAAVECEKCGASMELREGRFGKYFRCLNANCGNTRKMLANGQPAPPRMDPVPLPELRCLKVEDHYVLRDGAAGLFLAASQYPRKRETRAPLVSELLPLKGRLPEKYDYLLSAPVEDPDGNPAQVRFSRKTGQQYVSTEKNGRATGWLASYQQGQWVPGKREARQRKR